MNNRIIGQALVAGGGELELIRVTILLSMLVPLFIMLRPHPRLRLLNPRTVESA